MAGKQTWSATLYDTRHDYVARYGAALLEWLAPRPGEVILDLGCGTGDLSVRIAQAGAEVWGVDADPTMLAQARAKFPDLRFLQADAMALPDFGRTFDAVFSNAVLHWIPDLDRLAEGLARTLRPGGRFVAECGGIACNAGINEALRLTAEAHGLTFADTAHFRPLSELAVPFERAGFRVTRTEWFPRDTPLQGEDGMLNFLRMFRKAPPPNKKPSSPRPSTASAPPTSVPTAGTPTTPANASSAPASDHRPKSSSYEASQCGLAPIAVWNGLRTPKVRVLRAAPQRQV